jgi:hypothetical protein
MDVSFTDWNFGMNPPGYCCLAGNFRMNQKSDVGNIYKLKNTPTGMA